jgi:hypothetical protein
MGSYLIFALDSANSQLLAWDILTDTFDGEAPMLADYHYKISGYNEIYTAVFRVEKINDYSGDNGKLLFLQDFYGHSHFNDINTAHIRNCLYSDASDKLVHVK